MVLVGQYRYPTDGYSWEIVEGGVDDGEDHVEAARRELEEEAGLVAESWVPLGGEMHLSNSVTSERAFLYVATGLSDDRGASRPDRGAHHPHVPLDEAVAW